MMKIRLMKTRFCWVLGFSVSLLLLFTLAFRGAGTLSGISALSDRVHQLREKVSQLEREITEDEKNHGIIAQICNCRLSVSSTDPLPSANQTSQGTIYVLPFEGDKIALYNGTSWIFYTFSSVSLALTGLTADKNYDVFLYNNSGTLTLALSVWTDNTTRATAVALQDGVYIKSGTTTYRYIGTIRTTSTTTTEDSDSKRFVWNYYNRRKNHLKVIDATDTWSYSTASWRAANNSSGNKVEFVIGINEALVQASAHLLAASTADGVRTAAVGIGLSSATANSAQLFGGDVYHSSYPVAQKAEYLGYPGIGYYYLQWLEYGHASGINFYGDNNKTQIQSGMVAMIEG